MNKEYIQNRIEQVAYDGATDGYNQAVIEREAEKLATEIVKLFAIPDVTQQRELLLLFQKDYNKRNFDDCLIAEQDIELFLKSNSG